MDLNQTKLENHRRQLRKQLTDLESVLEKASESDRDQLERALQLAHERLSAINQVILRNVSKLPKISQKVLVSTNHSSHSRRHAWTARLLSAILEADSSEHDSSPRYELVDSDGEGGEPIRTTMLKEMSECYCFVAIVVPPTADDGTRAESQGDESKIANGSEVLDSLLHLHEELGIAFALCKPIILAHHDSLESYKFGPISLTDTRRISFATGGETWIQDLAGRLIQALDVTPRQQMTEITSRRRMIGGL